MNHRNHKTRYQLKFHSFWLALTLLYSISQAQSGFESLFNGKDLSGWEGQSGLWKVENGAIVGSTHGVTLKANTFLVWKGEDAGDFHLKFSLRLSGENNSGIMYRAQSIDGVPFGLSGNQLDIHPRSEYLGMYYSEKTGRGIVATRGQKVLVTDAVDEKGKSTPEITGNLGMTPEISLRGWNEYEVIAAGDRVIHKVNGIVTVDVTDRFPGVPREGKIGIQLHRGPPMIARVRDVRLKPLTGKAAKRALEAAYFKEGASVNENRATPRERITVKEGFEVELLYSVPQETQGSWVNMCIDAKGRLIASDQFGGLFRFPAPKPGEVLDPDDIEKVPAEIIAGNGLLWAFDALYVGVNNYEDRSKSGLYRVTDSNGDDKLDKVELLRQISARGDHGVHAVRLSPNGESIFLITGNNTEPTEWSSTRVNTNWGEDHLLPRMPDGRGHNRDRLAPAGIIYEVSPDGKEFEIYSHGYRNIFDADFNADGELFTYDADMEYDLNTPWYRPTRVNHVVSGSDYGWRNGTGKWPEWYIDTVPAAGNIGPGAPTGVTFGYGAKFPPKYQKALFILDWSWGKIYATHLEPKGSSYGGDFELFLSGAPMPVTDAVINPKDGAMYFTIGGRRVQSGLYRITYIGDEDNSPVNAKTSGQRARNLRRSLEQYHGVIDANAVKKAWRYLDHEDPFMRSAARIAIESQPSRTWANRALKERSASRQIPALLALARVEGIDPFHRKDSDPTVNKTLGEDIVNALLNIDFDKLSEIDQRGFVRTYQVVFNRFGRPKPALAMKVTVQLDTHFPASTLEMNQVLCETLVYLQSPTVAKKAIALLKQAPTQEEQLEYARSLRMLTTGWTNELRTEYIDWFLNAANYRGGRSFQIFVENIRKDALNTFSDEEQKDLAKALARKPEKKSPMEALTAAATKGRAFVKNWTMEDITPYLDESLENRDFDNGRAMFAAAACYACHRFGNAGGSNGPDLTGSGGRYSAADFIDQIINPSKSINEQFVPLEVTMLDGTKYYGNVVNLNKDAVLLNTDLYDPNQRVSIDRKKVATMGTSEISPMPPGLLNLLSKDDILDLTAYVLSAGNREDRRFASR
ncbi:MAG: DUF1080 domain-containing protein [Opitutales bacterium]|nr:DUF1080 domain-containing protein [Opitutales bacterium]